MGKYLNEEKYQKNVSAVKVVGITLIVIGILALIAGLVFILIGIGNMGTTVINGFNTMDSDINQHSGIVVGMFKTYSLTSSGFFTGFVGFALLIIGIFLLFIGNRREIKAFAIQQTLPVEREMIDEMTPTVANSAGEIAKSVKKGLKEGEK